jgi:2,3-bisphosphoglycerate-independent phosphoglycerate mutase
VVVVLLILDGASEPVGAAPTSLERARTPLLDQLAAEGTLLRLRTVPAGLPAGSETASATLLGWAPPAPVDRGVLEAAARGIQPAAGERAWRVDCVQPDGTRAEDSEAARAAHSLRAVLRRHRVVRLSGHRLLVWGKPPLPALPSGLRAWAEGTTPPRTLDRSTTVVAATGAVAGLARLMGAHVVVPAGATGRPDTDLASKAAAVARAVTEGAGRVVVHVAAPDEAAHQRDAEAKVAAIERIDRELLPDLVRSVRDARGMLRVCPDHGCDPSTGDHDSHPVPALRWTPTGPGDGTSARMTERAVAGLPPVDVALPTGVA